MGSSQIISNTKRNTALDGLRGLAILIVVLSHTHVLENGGLGNAVFFALSGFFAAMPFADFAGGRAPERKVLSLKGIRDYYIGKFFRIYPAYFTVIVAMKVLFRDRYFSGDLLSVLTFRTTFDHLWFLQQDVIFCLILPLILIPLFLLDILPVRNYKGELLCAVLLIAAAFVFKYHPPKTVFFITTGHFRLNQILAGMAGGYIYRFLKHNGKEVIRDKRVLVLSQLFTAACALMIFLSSHEILRLIVPAWDEILVGWKFPLFTSFLASACALLILMNGNCAVNRILGNKLFVFLGSVSYSIYLIHKFLIDIVAPGWGLRAFAIIMILSTGTAYLLDLFITRPFIRLGKTRSIREFAAYYGKLRL